VIDRADVQGLVFSGYTGEPVSRVFLLDFERGDGRGWLRRVLPFVTSARERDGAESVRRNLAFTAQGLRSLGLPMDVLAEFSAEFRQGMAHPARSRVLGDAGEDAPAAWDFGGADDRIDAVLLVYARSAEKLAAEASALERGFERFAIRARAIDTFLPADGREHFGFRMGVSEPGLTRREHRRGRERVPLGEFLLGHLNAYGERAEFPTAPIVRSTRDLGLSLGDRHVAFGRNGSYLVVRKLEQRVAEFRSFVAGAAGESGAGRAACLVGRWPNGAPLVLRPEEPPSGAPWREQPFGYSELDASGARCPLGAHVRRAHPRDLLGRSAQFHRLLRRGRLYGPSAPGEREARSESGAERGLLFLALNADLSRQFETVQGTFLNGRAGLETPRTRDDLARFVRVRGGLYAFLPSISALNYLLESARP
jgi:Dyp-type peroxidase family